MAIPRASRLVGGSGGGSGGGGGRGSSGAAGGGLTLLELQVAIIVLAFAIVMLASLLATRSRSLQRSQVQATQSDDPWVRKLTAAAARQRQRREALNQPTVNQPALNQPAPGGQPTPSIASVDAAAAASDF